METSDQIRAMQERLEANIREHGWDATVDGASMALGWVLGDTPLDFEAVIAQRMERPDSERRREWIARGGDPNDWPEQR